MEEIVGGAVAIIAVVSIFVLLPWMILHHGTRRREAAARQAGDPAMNSDLLRIAEKLEKRVQSLETILDAEVPGWRKNLERKEH